MGVVSFSYLGKVRGQGRPRFDGRSRRTYEADTDKAYKAAIQAAYMEQSGAWFVGAVSVYMTVTRPLPKRKPKRITEEPDTLKPDLDNIVKAVLDALNGFAWADDAQVVEIHARKEPRRHGVAEGFKVVIYGEVER